MSSLDSTQALADHGFPPERLLGFARQIAWDRHVADGSDRWEDLVSFLVEKGLQCAVRYDPAKRSVSSYSFSSWLYDVMEKRVPDFYRRQAEGYADHRDRYKTPRSPHLVTEPGKLEVDEVLDELEAVASLDRLAAYRDAAAAAGMPLGEWTIAALDAAARFGR